MKLIVRIVYGIFIILLIEILGWGLLHFFSKGNDFISNQNYDKIRAMLLADNNSQTVSKYIHTPYLTYIPNPSFEKNGYVQHNNSGYRGEEVPLKKGEKFRVLCLGGSTTYGFGVDDPQDSYPAQLKKILQSSGEFSHGVEVINAGIEAGTSAEELTHYLLKYRYYQPDLVVIHSGGNDVFVFKDDIDYQLDYTNYRKTRFHIEPAPARIKWMFHSRFVSFIWIWSVYGPMMNNSIDMYANRDVESVRIAKWTDRELISDSTIPDLTFHAFYQNHKLLIQNILNDGAEVLNMSFGHDPSYYETHNMPKVKAGMVYNNKIIEQVSEELHVVYIPFEFSSISDPSYWLDDCHLNEKGENEKAELVAKYILNELAKKDEGN